MHERVTHYFGDDCPGGHTDACVASEGLHRGEVAMYEVEAAKGRRTYLPLCEGHAERDQ